jgi:DNA (cytosine-5)-methyltransferase 1
VTRPRLLDLFCKAGGASYGYSKAGFDVWGVDREHCKAYPFTQVTADALDILEDDDFLAMFDAFAASPPCQANSRTKHLRVAQGKQVKAHGEDLIPLVREALIRTGRPYVIENVPGAPLRRPLVLCGSSFGLRVRRHRLFESNVCLLGLPCDHAGQGRPVGVYGSPNDDIPQGGRTARTVKEAQEAMGITWMDRWDDIKEAVPWAYTKWIGSQLLSARETL